tara:strand:- start:315 stop:521 length:207 start_codon:yes stop_codon:yes gene_type:complete
MPLLDKENAIDIRARNAQYVKIFLFDFISRYFDARNCINEIPANINEEPMKLVFRIVKLPAVLVYSSV